MTGRGPACDADPRHNHRIDLIPAVLDLPGARVLHRTFRNGVRKRLRMTWNRPAAQSARNPATGINRDKSRRCPGPGLEPAAEGPALNREPAEREPGRVFLRRRNCDTI